MYKSPEVVSKTNLSSKKNVSLTLTTERGCCSNVLRAEKLVNVVYRKAFRRILFGDENS